MACQARSRALKPDTRLVIRDQDRNKIFNNKRFSSVMGSACCRRRLDVAMTASCLSIIVRRTVPPRLVLAGTRRTGRTLFAISCTLKLVAVDDFVLVGHIQANSTLIPRVIFGVPWHWQAFASPHLPLFLPSERRETVSFLADRPDSALQHQQRLPSFSTPSVTQEYDCATGSAGEVRGE